MAPARLVNRKILLPRPTWANSPLSLSLSYRYYFRMTTNELEMISNPGKDKWSVEQLFAKCEDLLSRFEYEAAEKFCDRILQIEPNHLETLQIKASILMDTGDVEGAHNILLQCVSLEPAQGHEKYLALAQVAMGQEALGHLQTALSVLQNTPTTEGAGGDSEKEYTRKQTCGIYCSIAELYMTDLCMEAGAEGSCETALQKALQASPSDYEVLQTMASMRISQNRPEEAITLLLESISQWSMVPIESVDFPTYEFRLTCSRLLVELDSCPEARTILEALTVEDDEVLECWYLLALVYFRLQRYRSSFDSLEMAKKLLSRDEIAKALPEFEDAIAELEEALGAVEIPEIDEEEEDSSSASDNEMSIDEGDLEGNNTDMN